MTFGSDGVLEEAIAAATRKPRSNQLSPGEAMCRFAERWLLAHDWPGNVRELENTIERGVVMAEGDVIGLDDLTLGSARARARAHPADASGTLAATLDAATAARIRQALRAAGGVKIDAARELGIERTTLYRLMKKLQIEA